MKKPKSIFLKAECVREGGRRFYGLYCSLAREYLKDNGVVRSTAALFHKDWMRLKYRMGLEFPSPRLSEGFDKLEAIGVPREGMNALMWDEQE